MSTTYTEQNTEEIAALLVGRKIVSAEKGVTTALPDSIYSHYGDIGRLTLDDGTVLLLAGHDGGCGCSAGCYELERVAEVDNVITSARVECAPSGDDYPENQMGMGTYRIFVFADAGEINVAEFVGSDGNGYYGTGFWLAVEKPS